MRKICRIPTIALILFLSTAVLAQTPGSGPTQGAIPMPGVFKEEPPTDAESTLDAAIAGLKSIISFSADIVQSVDMLNQKFDVKGVYLRASNHRVYLKLAVSGLGDTPATTLQVCDGATLWDYQQVLETQSYRKLTMTSILKKLNDPILDADKREQILSGLGFAGPEAMLVGLRRAVRFDQKAEDKLDGKKVWVIRGQWKDRAGLVGPGQQPLPPTMPLPSYIPSNVTIWIGQDDHWPYRIDMIGNALSLLQQDSRRLGPDGRPIGPKIPAPKVNPSRISLKYTNVKINPDLPPGSFAFTAPADAKGVADGTDEFLSRLYILIQSETNKKKAEGAKADPVFGGSIDVPKTSPPPTNTGPAAPTTAPLGSPDAPVAGPDVPARPK